MNSNNNPKSINHICEGLGCSAKATSKVPIQVGAKGRIVLLLCEGCKQRFSHSKSQSASDAPLPESNKKIKSQRA